MKNIFAYVLFCLFAPPSMASVPSASLPDTAFRSSIILVKLIETDNSDNTASQIIVCYGKDSLEYIQLQKIGGRDGYPVSNMEKIHVVMTRLYARNYELVSTYEVEGEVNFIFHLKMK